jgi:hypothetical protein
VLDLTLKWSRRVLAVVVLGVLPLPLVTMHGCSSSRTYTGLEAVSNAPLLLSIPLFAVVVIALTFLNRRPAPAIGRLVLAMLKTIWVAVCWGWTAVFFSCLTPGDGATAEIGGLIVIGAVLGILACDLIESCQQWIAWRRWRREHAIPLIRDPLLRITRWAICLWSGVLALIAVGFGIWVVGQGCQDLRVLMLSTSLVLLFLVWLALAGLVGWGIRRGLRWAYVLQHSGAYAALACIALSTWAILDYLTSSFSKLRTDIEPQVWLVLIPTVLWALVTWWTVRVVMGWRRRMFPARRIRRQTPKGTYKVRVPACPACGSRLWLSLDGARLVCRPCGTSHDAALAEGELEIADAADSANPA